MFQGQEIGIRLTHWAPTGNEVDLEFADFARYFADQPEVGVIACYIEGFKDGRTLMLAADHAAQLRKPIVMVKVGRTEAGRSMAQSHTGHLTGSDAVTSAVFRQFGVTRVDGLDELLEVSAALARTRPDKLPAWAQQQKRPGRVRLRDLGRHRRAHGRHAVADAGLRLPDLTKPTQQALHDGLIPAYLRVSNPVDCGGPPVADRRGRKILDAILADKNVDIVVIPITGAVAMFSEPFTRDIIEASKTTTKPIFVIWGAPSGTDDTYYKRLLDGGLPMFRTFGNCVAAVQAYVDYWTFAARYRSPFDDGADHAVCPPRRRRARCSPTWRRARRCRSGSSKKLLKAYGIKTSRRTSCARRPTAAAKAASAIGFPVVMKVSSPDLLHKSDAGLVQGRRRLGQGSARRVRRAAREGAAGRTSKARIEGVLVCEMVTRRRRDARSASSHDELFGPVVTVGLGGDLRRGVRRRDVPGAAVRRERGAPRAARAQGLQAARRRARRASRPTSTRSSTRS